MSVHVLLNNSSAPSLEAGGADFATSHDVSYRQVSQLRVRGYHQKPPAG